MNLDNKFVEQAKWFLVQSDLGSDDLCSNIWNCCNCFMFNFQKERFCSTEEMIKSAKQYLRNEKLKKIQNDK